jgi:nucleoid-associated protein YgaU
MQQGKKALEHANTRYHEVVPGDSLSKISGKYYSHIHKWPVIYEANRDVVGRNANLIKPGQQLLIPDLPTVHGISG